MSGRFATQTKVAVHETRLEIEKLLKRYGATSFVYGEDPEHAAILFEMRGRRMRYVLPYPDPEDEAIRCTAAGRLRSTQQIQETYEQVLRSRWRALLLMIRGKLEAIELGVITLEEAFLPEIVLPSGETVGQVMRPRIEETYRTGRLPALLPGVAPALGSGEERAA